MAKNKNEEDSLRLDLIERELLKEYFKFVNEYKSSCWIHWNMNSARFGYLALCSRYQALGGKPAEIPQSQWIDLSSEIQKIYGENYISHPRFINICRKNLGEVPGLMSGREEAEAFMQENFKAILDSAERKVHCIQALFKLVIKQQLKTDMEAASAPIS